MFLHGSAATARMLALTAVFGLVGFCYSINTHATPVASRSSESSSVAPRVIGSSTPRFLSPLYLAGAPNPTTGPFDLGDAFFGSDVLRIITATGGVRPYLCAQTFPANVLGANSSLDLLAGGCLVGSATASTTLTDFMFTATLKDSTGPTIKTSTSTFHLFLYPSSNGIFRFAHDRLNTGVLGQSYSSKLETLGGKGGVKFSILPGSITFNGQAVGTGSSLESFGLSLTSGGIVFGRPLRAGLIGFTAHATDAIKRVAKNRPNASFDQPINFNVEDSKVTATDMSLFKVSVRGHTTTLNADSVVFNAVMNLGFTNAGTPQLSLRGKMFTFLLGGARYDGFINQTGKVVNSQGKPLVFADGSKMDAGVDAVNGFIKGKISRANLGNFLDAANIPARGTRRYACAIMLCDFVVASDMLEFSTKSNSHNFSLDYNVGRLGTPLGGTFNVYVTQGADKPDIAGNPADAWLSRFILIPRFGVDDAAGITPFDSIGVRIGTNFQQTIPFTAFKFSNNGNLELLTKGTGAFVNQFKLNTRSFSGMVLTNPLAQSTTGLPVSTDPNIVAPTNFNLAIDVNRTPASAPFSGEDGKFIFPTKKNTHLWIDRVSKIPGLR